MKNNQLTVVIPTLGKKNMLDTLKILNSNKFIKEIIISLPNNSIINNYHKHFKKVKVIYSRLRGQVYQRISAYNFITTKYILYIDDDIIFDRNLVKNLFYSKLKKGHKSVIAPIYYDKQNKKKIHPLKGNLIFSIKKLIHFFLFNVSMGASRMGKISLAGSCYGVDGDFIFKNPLKTNWLPGGCFIISKEHMIKYNYYNCSGKAYCEDLILSSLLIKNNIKLYVEKNAKVFTDPPTKIKKTQDLIDYLNGHKIYCRQAKLKNLRVKIWRFIFLLRLKLKNFKFIK
tara:strand:+ start:707 stop:1561 length:855 start_codon:yes stop_codon:yes gene_type:complete